MAMEMNTTTPTSIDDMTPGAEWLARVEMTLRESISDYLTTHSTRELMRFIAAQL